MKFYVVIIKPDDAVGILKSFLIMASIPSIVIDAPSFLKVSKVPKIPRESYSQGN
jgi:hypothetical protein